MSDVYIVKSQLGHFVSKQKEWVDGSEPQRLFRSKYKDEAVNLVFEMSSRDIHLRAEALLVATDDDGQPQVEVTNPIPREAAAAAECADDSDAYPPATEELTTDELSTEELSADELSTAELADGTDNSQLLVS